MFRPKRSKEPSENEPNGKEQGSHKLSANELHKLNNYAKKPNAKEQHVNALKDVFTTSLI